MQRIVRLSNSNSIRHLPEVEALPHLAPFTQQVFSGFSSELVAAIEAAAMPGLGDGPPPDEPENSPLHTRLLDPKLDSAIAAASPLGNQLCRSGLWLLAGDLDRSHQISQQMDEKEGSFWHGIMHRREGDFSNAKYWFRRVGKHPVITQLIECCGDAYRTPEDFVDRCANAIGGSPEEQASCQDVQWQEWQLLMSHCVAL
ncbi:MAG: hypothetical protein ACF788_10470 [Novipirellula sp. JB048]